MIKTQQVLYQSIIIGLILLTAWLRLCQLISTPPGFWFDEAYNAMDAVWASDTGFWPIFLVGNNGREVLFHYLLIFFTSIFGEKPYTIRLVSVLLGILTIPIMYRWVLTIFKDRSNAHWLALVAATGLVTSFWYLMMNRTGYRANLLPLFVIVLNYFFWRGWQTNRIVYYILAGATLGFSQYTYLSARLLPLIFILFLLAQTIFLWKEKFHQLKIAWVGLLVMGSVSVIISLPLLLFFSHHPESFFGRAGDVAVKIDGSLESLKLLGAHLWQSVRVFVDGQDPNLRHHLVGRPVLEGFSTVGFVVGLLYVLRNFQMPINIFLLVSLFVLWLPAPLSEPAFHTLRLSGILPVYYVFVAVGWFSIVHWLNRKFVASPIEWHAGLVSLALVLIVGGGITLYDYFYRWGPRQDVYEAFDGHVVDLASYLTDPKSTMNPIIPYYLYTHASMRYFLSMQFEEKVLLTDDAWVELSQQKNTPFVIPAYPPDDGKPPAFVWLVRNKDGSGTAYVSAVARMDLARVDLSTATPITGSRDTVIGNQYDIEVTDALLRLFPQSVPSKMVTAEWDDNLRLLGYQFDPVSIESNEITTLNLNWEILGHTNLPYKMFLQVLDSRGQPIGQVEVDPISRKMYRWRYDGLILEQFPLDFDVELEPGLYFARLGFFDPKTNERVSAYNLEKELLGDELIVGPFYVAKDQITQPQYIHNAILDDSFELLGYTVQPLESQDSTAIELFWKVHRSVDIDYTVFVQLLDSQNQVIAQVDVQPLAGIYPTSRWQTNDIITEKFILPVLMDTLTKENQLVTGMYDLTTGVRLSVHDNTGQLLPDGLIYLSD